MQPVRGAKRILENKPKERRARVRPRLRWLNEIKNYMKAIGVTK